MIIEKHTKTGCHCLSLADMNVLWVTLMADWIWPLSFRHLELADRLFVLLIFCEWQAFSPSVGPRCVPFFLSDWCVFFMQAPLHAKNRHRRLICLGMKQEGETNREQETSNPALWQAGTASSQAVALVESRKWGMHAKYWWRITKPLHVIPNPRVSKGLTWVCVKEREREVKKSNKRWRC